MNTNYFALRQGQYLRGCEEHTEQVQAGDRSSGGLRGPKEMLREVTPTASFELVGIIGKQARF